MEQPSIHSMKNIGLDLSAAFSELEAKGPQAFYYF
jgi:hypothetical protein